MNTEIIKSQKYKKILCECLETNEDNIKLPDISYIEQTLFKLLDFNSNGELIFNSNSIDYGILLKTEFIFFIDNVFIGIFDNKYIVSMREADLSFYFVGDTESNWLEDAFGWGHQCSDLFMEECFKEFGIPIKKFDSSFLSEQFIYSLSYKK